MADEAQRKAIEEVAAHFSGKAFERAAVLTGTTYQDNSTIIIVPSRKSMIHYRVVSAWQSLIAPMNQKRLWLFVINDEVGVAYTNTIKMILDNPELSTWKYILTLESDNLPPPDAHVRLLETIEAGKFDAVGGIYFTKGNINMPMAYGDPEVLRATGKLEFTPRDPREALTRGLIMPVNGIAMGCSLYRLQLFREVPAPWFVTANDVIPGKGVELMTQDLYFCKTALAAGKRFAIDFRVRVGHLDESTGEVY